MLPFIQTVLLVSLVASAIFAYYLAKKIRHGLCQKIAFVHTLSIFAWGLCILVNITLPTVTGQWSYVPGDLGFFIGKLLFASTIVVLTAQLWFVSLFPDRKPPQRYSSYWSLLFPLVLVGASFFDHALFSAVHIQDNGSALLDRGPITPLYTLFFMMYITLPCVILYRRWRCETNLILKTQYKILLSSHLLFDALALTTNWILPVYFGISSLNALGPAFSLILVAGMNYAATHYRFLDLRLSMQRSLTYTASVGIVLVVIFCAVFSVPVTSTGTKLAVDTITVLVVLIVFSPLKQGVSSLLNLLLFGTRTNYAERMRALADRLNESEMNISDAIRHIVATIQQGLLSTKCRLVFQTADARAYSELPSHMGNSQEAVLRRSHAIVQRMGETKESLVSQELEYRASIGDAASSRLAVDMKKHGLSAAVPVSNKKGDIPALLLVETEAEDRLFSEQELGEARLLLEKMMFYIHHASRLMHHREGKAEWERGVFHEFNTPLTLAQLEADSLSRDPVSGDAIRSSAGTISRHIKTTSRLLKQYMEIVVLLKEGPHKLQYAMVSLDSLIDEALLCVKQTGDLQHVGFEWQREQFLETVCVDAQHIREVFVKIFQNALHAYESQKSGVVRIVSQDDEKSSIMLQISIEDEGRGISPNDLPHVFDTFYRADKSRTDGKTGFGLSYCKAVMEAHGGNITLESVEGVGTTVRLLLPRFPDSDL